GSARSRLVGRWRRSASPTPVGFVGWATSSARRCSQPSADPVDLLITISGLPGSGTTTLSRVLAADLHLERVPGGEVFRQLASEGGMSLAQFGAYAQDHPEIDQELDHRLTVRAEAGDCVIESRLAGWLVTRAGLTAVRVWVDC